MDEFVESLLLLQRRKFPLELNELVFSVFVVIVVSGVSMGDDASTLVRTDIEFLFGVKGPAALAVF